MFKWFFTLFSLGAPEIALLYVAVCNHGAYGEILFQLETDHE